MELLVSQEKKQNDKSNSPLKKFAIDLSNLNTKPFSEAKKPPVETSRSGDRVIEDEGGLSEKACFKACVVIENPMEFDRNHDGFC